MKYIIKSISLYLFLIVLSFHYASSANASSCEEIKKDRAALKESPGHYYFRIGLCEFKVANNKIQFDTVIEALTKSSKYDYYPAYFALGLLYQNRFEDGSVWFGSKGEIDDLLKSIGYYEEAAKNQSATAENKLGEIYLHYANFPEESRTRHESDNIPGASKILPNLDKAIYWLERAAKHGNPAAQGTLSDLYLHGIGIPQDFVMAYVWQNLSVASQFRYNKKMQDNNIGRHLVNNHRLVAEKQYNKLTNMQKDQAQALLKEYTNLYFKPPTELDEFDQSTQSYISASLILRMLN